MATGPSTKQAQCCLTSGILYGNWCVNVTTAFWLQWDTQPSTVVRKMEAQLECNIVHNAHRLGADLYAQSAIINKISASEPSRKLIKIQCWLGTLLKVLLYSDELGCQINISYCSRRFLTYCMQLLWF